jgi:hypothetical protein
MDSLEAVRLMARVCILGLMGKFMMESGFKAESKAMAFGEGLIMITI